MFRTGGQLQDDSLIFCLLKSNSKGHRPLLWQHNYSRMRLIEHNQWSLYKNMHTTFLWLTWYIINPCSYGIHCWAILLSCKEWKFQIYARFIVTRGSFQLHMEVKMELNWFLKALHEKLCLTRHMNHVEINIRAVFVIYKKNGNCLSYCALIIDSGFA
jgi:hypothetical protein